MGGGVFVWSEESLCIVVPIHYHKQALGQHYMPCWLTMLLFAGVEDLASLTPLKAACTFQKSCTVCSETTL